MIETPWGEVQTPFAILPYFYCPKCGVDVNIGDCSHNRQDFTPPIWIREYLLWKKGRFEVEGELLDKFRWLEDNASISLTNPGFETGNYNGWTTSSGGGGTLSVASDQAREGTYSSKLAATQTTSNGYIYQSFSNKTEVYSRCYFRIDTLLSGNWKYLKGVVALRSTNGGVYTVWWDYWTDGSGNGGWRKERWYPSYNISSTDTSYGPSVNTWHCLEGHMKINASTGEYHFYQDGNELTGITETGINTSGAGNINNVQFQVFSAAHSSSTWNCWIDSVVADDSTYIGPIGGPTQKSVSDTLGLSDAAPSIAAAIPVTDTSSLAEALSIAAQIPVSDVAGLSDDLAVKAYLALSDTVAFAEAVSIAASLSLSDSVSLSETLSIATFIPVSDTVTLSEAISVLVRAFKTVYDVVSISDESVSVVKTEAPAEERLLGGGGRYYRRRRRRARRYKFVTEYDGKGVLHVVEELEAQGDLTVRNNLYLTGTSTVTSTLQGGGSLLVKQHLVGSEHQVVCGKIEAHGRSTRYRDVLTALLVYAATGDR